MAPVNNREDAWVGQNIRRREDAPLLTGSGRYVADIHLPDTTEVAFVRSPVAHAHIRDVDVSEAMTSPGVLAVFTAKDIQGKVAPFSNDYESTPHELESTVRPIIHQNAFEVLPDATVRYVGQAVVAVVAESRYAAEDGADRVEIDYEEMPAVVDPDTADSPEAPTLYDSVPSNVQMRYRVSEGDAESAFATAPHQLQLRVRTQRVAASPMETRGVLASYSDTVNEMTVWSSTQVPYLVRRCVAAQLGFGQHQVRVVAPDVGGGFGCKVMVYPEEVLIPYIAYTLGRTVRWIEDRHEHLVATAHGRDQTHHIRAAFDDTGYIDAIQDSFVLDCGVYNQFPLSTGYNPASHLRTVYRVPNFSIFGKCVLTNKTPNGPYRGASRPESAFAMDRLIYEVAHYLGRDPAEVLHRNLIPAAEMPYPRGIPYRDGKPIIYDYGDASAAFARLCETVGYGEHKRAQQELRDRGTYRGIGFGTYVEGSGVGPFESATVQLDSRGHVVVHAGCAPHGQSHATTLSQVVADEFLVRPEDVVFRAGDTSLVPYGVGTFASRSAVTAGSAAFTAARQLKRRLLLIASEMLEAAPEDLKLADGGLQVIGEPQQRVSFADVFQAASPGPASRVPEGMSPGCSETSYFVPPTVTWGFGIVAAVVEVDPQSGAVKVRRLGIAHDCGRVLHPEIVEGQIEGGLMQGVGATLYEAVVYDERGQPLSTGLMDYLLPTTGETPEIVQTYTETPSELNPLQVKGVGEAGSIAPPAAIANAIADALGLRGVNELPLSPEVIAAAASSMVTETSVQKSVTAT